MTSTFGNVISAFSEEQVERLTGLTKFRLRYWDRTDFFTPSLAEENRRLAYSRVYSFRDLASLRVLSVLLNQYNVSLQHLRQVSRKLTHLAENKWTGTTLYVLKRKVLFVEPGEETPREIVSGQYALGIPLEKVLAFIRAWLIAKARLNAIALSLTMNGWLPVRAFQCKQSVIFTMLDTIQSRLLLNIPISLPKTSKSRLHTKYGTRRNPISGAYAIFSGPLCSGVGGHCSHERGS
jgi:DNA-binding transcriptional MerR regulator